MRLLDQGFSWPRTRSVCDRILHGDVMVILLACLNTSEFSHNTKLLRLRGSSAS